MVEQDIRTSLLHVALPNRTGLKNVKNLNSFFFFFNFLVGSAVTTVWQDSHRRVPSWGSALHARRPGWPQRWRWRWHQCAFLLSWHDPERPRALRETWRAKSWRRGGWRRVTAREIQRISNWEGRTRGREGMKVKIRGTVRQIEAGDELSGSIINPHPLLFNILKSHTHSKQSCGSLQ